MIIKHKFLFQLSQIDLQYLFKIEYYISLDQSKSQFLSENAKDLQRSTYYSLIFATCTNNTILFCKIHDFPIHTISNWAALGALCKLCSFFGKEYKWEGQCTQSKGRLLQLQIQTLQVTECGYKKSSSKLIMAKPERIKGSGLEWCIS